MFKPSDKLAKTRQVKNSSIDNSFLKVTELRAFLNKYLGEELSRESIIKLIHDEDSLKTALQRAKKLNIEDPNDPHNSGYNPSFEKITFRQYSDYRVTGGKKRKSKKRKSRKSRMGRFPHKKSRKKRR